MSSTYQNILNNTTFSPDNTWLSIKTIDMHTGGEPLRVIVDGLEVEEEMLSNVVIEHKGCDVGVGSGFNQEERRLYFNNPERIIGKTITVQYFEETLNQDGCHSLRFPVVKHVYENGRTV